MEQKPSKLPVAALILGLLALIAAVVGFIGLPTGFVGLVLGIIGIVLAAKASKGGNKATAGLVLSVLASISVGCWVCVVALATA